MKTMVFRQNGRDFYVANGVQKITDEDFDAFMSVVTEAAADKQPLTILVWTDDAAPNSLQRSRLHKAAADAPLTVAVLTESSFARGAIMAFGWTGTIKIRGFAPTAIGKAIEYLGWTNVSVAQAQAVISELRAQLAGQPLASASP